MKKAFLKPFAITLAAATSITSIPSFAAAPSFPLTHEVTSQSSEIQRVQPTQLVIEPASAPQQQYADHYSHSSHVSHASHCSAYNSCKTP